MLDLLHRLRTGLFGKGKDIPFAQLCALYTERLARWPAPAGPPSRAERIGVLVTPWLGTPVPFFNLECALMLARAGCRVAVIWDDTDLVGNVPHDAAIAAVLARLEGGLEVIHAARLPPGTPDVPAAREILRNNAIWRMRGEDRADEFFENKPGALDKIAAHVGTLERMLGEQKLDWILTPGGIFGLSGAYVAAARKTGTRFTTYDASVDVVRLAHDGIAAHLADLPRAYQALRPPWLADPRLHERVLAIARAELDDRTHARDFRQFQVAAATQRDDLRYDLLVPLNIRWDSAALSRQRVFATVKEWLEALLEWVAAQPAVTICLREHPRERLGFAKGSDDWRAVLARFAHLGGRVRFVAAEEDVNSYDLLRHARVVLPHTSTFGIEAALAGKPVVMCTDCYYGGFGFVRSASTRREYFEWIGEAVAGAASVSPAQRDDAALAYCLTQRCAYVRTLFNPHRQQFLEWVKLPPGRIWATPETEDLRTALLEREPFSVVRYRRLTAA